MTGKIATLLCVTLSMTCLAKTSAADIIVLERESFAELSVFAGSGGAVNSYNNSDSQNSLSGGFSFGDSASVSVSESDPFSNGAASAFGQIAVSDFVNQVTADKLILSGTRTASGSAQWQAGTGNAKSTERQIFRVRFSVTDEPVQYWLTGNFDPGITTGLTGETGTMNLRRPFTSLTFFNISTAGPLNQTGIMQPGNTYEFRLLMTDLLSANSGNPGPISDFSSTNFQIRFASLSTIPEPCAAGIGSLLLLVIACQRRRSAYRQLTV